MVPRDAHPLGSDPRRVVTPIKVEKLKTVLDEKQMLSKWSHIIHGLEHGFDIGLDTAAVITETFIPGNHSTVNIDPTFISEYINGELEAGRYSGPYNKDQLEHLIGPFRSSPLGLVPKPGSDSFRLIQDLSYPRADSRTKSRSSQPAVPSVNSHIDSDDFPTEWGTFDSTSALIQSLPKGCMAAAFDIANAYRIIPTRPLQQNWLCISWEEKLYIDHALCFGLASSAGIFGSLADMILDIVRNNDMGRFRKWVDDFLGIRLPHENWTESDFINISADFGVPWKHTKTRPFSSSQKYLGFIWNLERKSVALPIEKFDAFIHLAEQWCEEGRRFTQKEALQLHGKLIHISCIFPLIRPFLRSIISFSSEFISTRAALHVPSKVAKDLSWVTSVARMMPPEIPLRRKCPVDLGWWGDASTSYGVAVVMLDMFAIWKWTDPETIGPGKEFDIKWGEAIAIHLGLLLADFLLKSASNHGHSSKFRKDTDLIVRSDNESLCFSTLKGRSRSEKANHVLKEIFIILARNRWMLVPIHVRSEDNISDCLSRGDLKGFLKHHRDVAPAPEIHLPRYLEHKMHRVA